MSDLWERVRQLNGRGLFTLARGKAFTVVGVQSDRIKFVPKSGKGTMRWAGRSQIEHVANLNLDVNQLTPTRLSGEYPDDQNLSYIAAIVHAVTKTA